MLTNTLTVYIVIESKKRKEVMTLKFKVEKMESVATCVIKSDYGPGPWKETKKHCL